MARMLKKEVDADKDMGLNGLIAKGLVPKERVYEVPEDVRNILQMDVERNCEAKTVHCSA